MRTLKRAYREFVREFLSAMFGPEDHIRLAVLWGASDMRNVLLPINEAVARLLELESTPNVYFAGAVFDAASGSYTKTSVSRTRCLVVDIDYGQQGHRSPAFFDTVEDAWASVMTAPLFPAGVWHTGHGLQALYLLEQTFVFRDGDQAQRIAEYEAVSRTVARMVMSDATFTPEHLFRVPLTLNAKPGTEPVEGTLLHWEPGRKHRFADLKQLCAQYGVSEDLEAPHATTCSPTDPHDDDDNAYADLPPELRAAVEKPHGDRSEAMFTIIADMLKAGYTPARIHDTIPHGAGFRQKYGRRLGQEIDRCIEKIQHSPRVYSDVGARLDAVDIVNAAQEVPLADCPALDPEMLDMLQRYAQVVGLATLAPDVQTAARFHEHLFRSLTSGVMETPCGSGKSTWAQCHIALNAKPDTQYLYVVDTLDTLYRAAHVIEKLKPGVAGRYHGFNAERCLELCGVAHNWQQCNPQDPASVCRRCQAGPRCAFYNRDTELQRPVVVMCHNGLVRLMESESLEPRLESAHIVVDEDLQAFLSAEFRLGDLELVEALVQSVGMTVKPFFPYTRFATAATQLDVKPGARTFAGLHYVYRDTKQTADLEYIVRELRRAVGIGKLDINASSAEAEHARQMLCELLTFFRPGYRGDQTYAYRELRDPKGVKYCVKKSRFDLGSQPVGKRLWILNASARLSPYPYPANMPVFQCAELKPQGYRVSLHVIAGNPMQSKQDAHIATACKIIREICRDRRHQAVFIPTDRSSPGFDVMAAGVRDSFGAATEIVHLERGHIRGSNTAGNCTFACLAGLSLFTSVDNVGATAALISRRTIPVYPDVFSKAGAPSMPGGRFKLKLMREIYALSALDELYQTVWRTTVRNAGQVEAVVVVPDAEWLSVLWRSVMPGYRTHGVHKAAAPGFKIDLAMDGLVFLMGVAEGREFKKQEVARLLGYRGAQAWKENQNRLRYLLEPFFAEGDSVQVLRRRPVS